MNKIITIVRNYIFVFLLLVVPAKSVLGQSITLETLIITVQNGACAGFGIPPYNTWQAPITLSGNFGANPTFKVELTDVNGVFQSPATQTIPLATINLPPDGFGNIKKIIQFGVPVSPPLIAGNNYRLRVVWNENQSVKSQNSTAFSAAYRAFLGTFNITGSGTENNIVTLCGSNNIELKVATGPFQPGGLGLKYIWTKNGTPIPAAIGESITTTGPGTYQAQIDYANCTDSEGLALSALITVISIPSNQSFQITPAIPAPVCIGQKVTLKTSEGHAYKWFRKLQDDKIFSEIPNETSYQYDADRSGTYHVEVTAATCTGKSNNVEVTVNGFNASLINTLSSTPLPLAPLTIPLAPSESKSITVVTNAAGPTFRWYKENVLLPTQTTDIFVTNEVGNYKVQIEQTLNCIFTKELSFILKEGANITQIPNVISPNNDGINDTWMIPQALLNNLNTEIKIINSFGEVVLNTSNYQNDWPDNTFNFKSVNPVFYYTIEKDGELINKGSITVVK